MKTLKNKPLILVGLKISSSKNFEKNIANRLPDAINEIYISSCGMNRASGYGSYNYFIDVKINDNEYITLTKFTQDSHDFDNYTDFEIGERKYDNWVKKTVLMLLEQNFELLEEKLKN